MQTSKKIRGIERQENGNYFAILQACNRAITTGKPQVLTGSFVSSWASKIMSGKVGDIPAGAFRIRCRDNGGKGPTGHRRGIIMYIETTGLVTEPFPIPPEAAAWVARTDTEVVETTAAVPFGSPVRIPTLANDHEQIDMIDDVETALEMLNEAVTRLIQHIVGKDYG